MNLLVQPFTPYANDSPDYWEFETYFQYVFTESPADSTSIIGEFYSNRSITTSSLCEAFPVIENLNASSSTLHYIENGTTQEMQFQDLIPASITYYTSPNLQDCGSRCASVYALENNGAAASFYYKCHINVSEVANATVLQHNVSDTNARIAAGAIALQGYQAQDEFNQSQTFPASQSIYGRGQNGNSTGMAEMLRKFAIGVFVASDNVPPNVAPPFPQLLPGQGVSYLTVADLLQPAVQKVKRRGYLLGGSKKEEPRPSVLYCDTGSEKGSGIRSVTSSKEDDSAGLWGFDCDL
jgi:hypothetical protein